MHHSFIPKVLLSVLLRSWLWYVTLLMGVIYAFWLIAYVSRATPNAPNLVLPNRREVCTHAICFDASLCAYRYRNISSRDRIAIYVYPSDKRVYRSHPYAALMQAIGGSNYAVTDPKTACLFIPNVDLLYDSPINTIKGLGYLNTLNR